MPKKAGGGADAETAAEKAAESEAVPPLPSLSPPPTAQDSVSESAAAPAPKIPAFTPPRPLSEVSFDDAKPSAATYPEFPDFPAAAPEAPSFTSPRPLSENGFDDAISEAPRPSPPPMPGFPGAGGGLPSAPQMPGASGMGISITGGPGLPGMPVAPKQTPAQISAGSQSLRIRLLRPDGKPFDGPEITTGPKKGDTPQGTSRTEFDAPRGPKKQAPKVVVKAGPLERAGHTLAVLLISAIGIVPLGYLLLQSVHDREDKLAATISVPTKMNVLDSTSEAYLGGMVAVLLVVAVLYWQRLKRRRER